MIKKKEFQVTSCRDERAKKEIESYQSYYSSVKSHPAKLDSIRSTQAEIARLADPLFNMSEDSSDLLNEPALEEFELIIQEQIPSNEMTIARFKRTVLTIPERTPIENDGKYYEAEMVPRIDAFLSFRNMAITDVVMTIYSVYGVCTDGTYVKKGTGQKDIWIAPDFRPSAQINYSELIEVMRAVKLSYLAIQKAMKEKPTIFVETANRPNFQDGRHSTSKRKRNKAKVEKVISLNKKEIEKYAQGHRHMNCPCWGVIGHWRQLKSGKRIWIAPYKKGKERNNPNMYQSKDYEFLEEVEEL